MNYKQLQLDNDIEQIMQELPQMIFAITGIDINSILTDFEVPAD